MSQMKANLGQAIAAAIHEAILMWGTWFAEAMRQLVNIQCGAYVAGWQGVGGHRRGHSPPGAAPYRESGRGQSGITMVPTEKGCAVGVPSTGTSGMTGQNYLAGHDTGEGVVGGVKRPWLSRFYTESQYQDELRRMITMVVRAKTGAR
jgi:hypothetical protein